MGNVAQTSNLELHSTIDYEERMVAFIDVLGWSDLIDLSVNDPELRRRMVAAIQALQHRVFEAFTVDFREYSPPDLFCEMSQISDTVILSRSARTWPYWFTIELSILAQAMHWCGFLVRGGISIGPLYHRNGIALGPALTRAHYIETGLAVFPRIVIDPIHAQRFIDSDSSDAGIPAYTVAVDRDGLSFIDYLRPVFRKPKNFRKEFLPRFRSVIVEQMKERPGSSRVHGKLLWLADYFDSLVTEYPKAGGDLIGKNVETPR